MDFAEVVSGDAGDAVVAGEFGVEVGVVGVEEFGDGSVFADEVVEEFDGFADHGVAEGGSEGGEAFGVWVGDFAEFIEVEPLAGEVA